MHSVRQPLAQELGPLLPAGPSAQPSPLLEPYAVEDAVTQPPAATSLSATLDRVGQAEPKVQLRGAREIELYRTLAPSVALVATDTGLASGSLIAIKPAAAPPQLRWGGVGVIRRRRGRELQRDS